MDSLEYRDEVASAAEYAESIMPDDIKQLIRLATQDLHFGPVYLDSDGDECSCFDADAKCFEFTDACARIGDWLSDHVEDLQCEVDYDEETGESDYERIDNSARDICKAIVGAELIKYIY
jgi:hypothetical protein